MTILCLERRAEGKTRGRETGRHEDTWFFAGVTIFWSLQSTVSGSFVPFGL